MRYTRTVNGVACKWTGTNAIQFIMFCKEHYLHFEYSPHGNSFYVSSSWLNYFSSGVYVHQGETLMVELDEDTVSVYTDEQLEDSGWRKE